MKRALGIAFASLLLSSTPAYANGRFPGALQLVKRNGELVLTSSFGVITTSDSFANTNWICEESLGYNPTQNNDLGAAIFGNGAIAFSGPGGLTVSTNRACANPKVNGRLSELWVADISVDAKTPSTGLAIVRGPQASEQCAGELFESTDEGRTWGPIGAKLPAGFCALTVDSAPSDPKRLYVSGNILATDGSKLIAQLLVSNNRGATWTPHEIPNEARPFIGAIDPLEKETVYVRTSNPPSSGTLLVSRDGGKTYTQIARLNGMPLNFFGVTGLAVSPDGKKLAYGSVNEGLFVIEAKGGEPQKRADFPVMCLTWEDDGLYACTTPSLCGPFFVGKSTDDGRTFATLLPSLDVHGDQTSCPAGSPTATLCPSTWASYKSRLGACPSDAGLPDAPSDASDAGVVPPRPPSIGCDCDTSRIGGAGPLGLAATFLVGLLALVRRTKSVTRSGR